MSKIKFDEVGERFYATGVRNVVLFPTKDDGTYDKGVAWNGITGIDENPEGADSNEKYADDILYLNLRSAEKFNATIGAYFYPDEFAACDGTAEPIAGVRIRQQKRRAFGLCYRTAIGNDTEMDDYGYTLHFVYGATAAPSSRSNSTINESPEAVEFSWEVSTIPVPVSHDGVTYRPTAHIEIDSTKVDAEKLKDLEAYVYGTDGDSTVEPAVPATDPTMPTPAKIFELLG